MIPPFSWVQHHANRAIHVARWIGSAPMNSGLENKAVGMFMYSISKKRQLGVVDFIKTRKTVFPRRCPNKGSWLASFSTSAVET